jgi:hypothetical protein
MSSCLIASKSSIINRSLHGSRFKVASNTLLQVQNQCFIYCNHCLNFKEEFSNCNSSMDTFNFGAWDPLCLNFGSDQLYPSTVKTSRLWKIIRKLYSENPSISTHFQCVRLIPIQCRIWLVLHVQIKLLLLWYIHKLDLFERTYKYKSLALFMRRKGSASGITE